jgi:RNA polymerase sigma-70 factor, ECF subfamily
VPTDPEILLRARQFEASALAQIYDLHSPGIYRYAMRRLGDQSLAEDCVAETFSRFLQALKTGHGPTDHLQAYLYRVAHNWIVDHFRQTSIPTDELTEEIRDGQVSTEEEAGNRMQQARLRTALRQLTPDQQQVIALKYLEGWANEEIAITLKKPVGAVKSLQHRALAALQRILQSEALL